jgi:hypothetical protein
MISAIYHSKVATNGLKVIRLGRSIRFLRSEVEALERKRELKGGTSELAT